MKANLSIVILSVVILLILPAAFVGTRMWNKHIQKNREAAATKAYNDLKALAVSYAFPPQTPSGTAVTLPLEAPNSVATAFFQEHRNKLESEIAKVGDTAKEINQAGHKMLVDGLWVPPPEPPKNPDGTPAAPADPNAPKAPTQVDQFKALELAELVVGRADKPSVYEGLLKGINAGGPADPVKVFEALNEEQSRFIDKLKAQKNTDKPSAEEQAELTKQLVALRVGQYQRHASEISVYATKDCLPADLPKAVPSEAPDAVTCFQWQFDYWTVSDLLKAVDAANTDASGKRTTLDKSVVKRIEKIDLFPAAPPTPASVTGRKSGGDNKLYDVRDASLQLVVSSAGLPQLINAISRTNFMTVIGLDFSEVDPWADMEKGYYYGPDHVVRAIVKVETVWLRSWTEALMPQAYKDLLTGTSSEASSPAAPAPAAPQTSRGRNAAPPADEEAVRSKSRGTKRPVGPKRGGDGG
jgi:hypothetical protein